MIFPRTKQCRSKRPVVVLLLRYGPVPPRRETAGTHGAGRRSPWLQIRRASGFSGRERDLMPMIARKIHCNKIGIGRGEAHKLRPCVVQGTIADDCDFVWPSHAFANRVHSAMRLRDGRALV